MLTSLDSATSGGQLVEGSAVRTALAIAWQGQDKTPEFQGNPAELQSIHDTIRKYRNTTVAHAQPEPTRPISIALLDVSGRVRDVLRYPLMQPVPVTAARETDRLVRRMKSNP
ncbi:hypothetical protein JOF48_000397 [Arthrobacter stackebrandtii]|uniref:Uncharacterized protein n=1 Tax=Arthrobacter stackebrandtii TaxID=272161 RepID=A0ABS4YUH1_9MICC|nr:hypothetical protein [Arthrobacter stackebrandtii]PYG99274.1 hypothetical protein CVV67_16260 [Arthrobacter stackebrandtii]